MNFTNNLEKAEKIENLRNKMLKYIVYKKRTEAEVREKFADEDSNLLEDTIEYFKEQKYIDDEKYIERSIKEFIALKNMSIKEVAFKLTQNGINKNLIDDYICKNKESMLEYEISSAKAIIIKKQKNLEFEDIKKYLFQKGYMSESIGIAFDEIEEAGSINE